MRKWIGYALGPVFMAAGIFFWLTGSGPYRWIAEWLFSRFGNSDEVLAGAVTIGVCVSCAMLIGRLMAGFRGKPSAGLAQLSAARIWDGAILCGAAGAIVLGTWIWQSAKSMTEPETVTVAELAARSRSPFRLTHRHVRIPHGRLLVPQAKDAAEGITIYVPLLEPGASPSGPAHVFLEASGSEAKAIISSGVKENYGIVALGTLPPVARAGIERLGVTVVPMPLVIQYHRDPESEASTGTMIAGFGALGLLTCIGRIWHERMHSPPPAFP